MAHYYPLPPPAHLRTRETADLFLALIIRLLKPGGRAAVVLPSTQDENEDVLMLLMPVMLTVTDWHELMSQPPGV